MGPHLFAYFQPFWLKNAWWQVPISHNRRRVKKLRVVQSERSSDWGYPSWGSVPVAGVILPRGAFRLVRFLGTLLWYAPG